MLSKENVEQEDREQPARPRSLSKELAQQERQDDVLANSQEQTTMKEVKDAVIIFILNRGNSYKFAKSIKKEKCEFYPLRKKLPI